MKKNLLMTLILALLIITMSKTTHAQQVIPDYGITKTGIIFIREEVVDRLCTAGDKIHVSGNWNGDANWVSWTEMTLMEYKGTGVYVYDCGKKINGSKIICFQLNENCYFPQAAIEKNDASYNSTDVVPNDKGGNNLKIRSCDIDFSS